MVNAPHAASSSPWQRGLLRLSLLATAAMPLLALVLWAGLQAPRSGHRETSPIAAFEPVRTIAAIPKVQRATTHRVPSAYELEARMSPAELLNRWNGAIASASKRFRVPQSWLRAVMQAESGGRTMSGENRPITSVRGAMGVMQLMPRTYGEMRAEYDLGPDPYAPEDNIVAAAAYLHWLYSRYGYPMMFAAYNDGPGNLEQRLIDGRMLPAETQLYVGSVAGTSAIARTGGARSLARFTRPDGTEVLINGFAVSSVRAALPGEYAPGVQSVIAVGKARQGVKEGVALTTQRLRTHGARV